MAKKTESITLKNHHIQFITSLLQQEMLHGQESRARNRFFSLVKDILQEIEDERKDLIKKYAELDDKGNPKIDEKKSFVFKAGEREKFIKEFTEYQNEDRVLDILPSNKDTFLRIRDILTKTKLEMNAEQGAVYDYILTEFESI